MARQSALPEGWRVRAFDLRSRDKRVIPVHEAWGGIEQIISATSDQIVQTGSWLVIGRSSPRQEWPGARPYFASMALSVMQ
jgi:hypothetical protein